MLQNLSENEVISKEKCVSMIADLRPDGKEILENHKRDFVKALV